MTDTPEDEFSELVNANLPRVDLVGKGANGLPFLVAKSADEQGGILSADLVRELVTKADPAPQEQTVTLSGSPAAIAAMIHNAPIRKTAEENAVSDTVAKDDGETAAVEVSDIIQEAPGGSTAESVPGSPDWEELDAATAESAIGVLGRAKAAIEWLVTREDTEAVTTGDGDDACNAWDLSDAAGSIDYAIRALGAFAAGEKLEAGLAGELEAVTKAAVSVAAPLGELEALAPVVKAGRVLSTANEARIKSASESLSEVLATLPAPIEDGLSVAKSEEETSMAEQTPVEKSEPVDLAVAADALADVAKAGDAADEATGELAAAMASVEKAKDPQVAVYTADGKLVGTVSQDDIAPIAAPAAPEGGDAQGDAAPAAAADDTTAAAPAAADAADLAPAPADQAGTPAAAAPSDDEVAKSEDPQDQVLKAVTEMVEAAVKDAHDKVVKSLQDQIDELRAPARPRVFSNGVIPTDLTIATRGQDATGTNVDVAKAEELQQQLATASTPAEREQIAKAMQEGATSVLAALHGQRPKPTR